MKIMISSAQQNALLNYSWAKQGYIPKNKKQKAIVKALEKRGLVSCNKQEVRITKKKKEIKISLYFLTDKGTRISEKLTEKRFEKANEIKANTQSILIGMDKENEDWERRKALGPIEGARGK